MIKTSSSANLEIQPDEKLPTLPPAGASSYGSITKRSLTLHESTACIRDIVRTILCPITDEKGISQQLVLRVLPGQVPGRLRRRQLPSMVLLRARIPF